MLDALAVILQIIGLALFKYQGWILIVAILGYSIWQNKRKARWVSSHDTTLLQIEVPKANDKKELSAEQMFASLHGILRPRAELIKEGQLQEHVSFEIASVGNQIRFYVWTPKHLKDFVEGQIYAQYPSVHITENPEDYAASQAGERVVAGTELALTKPEVLPIKTFQTFDVDPLAGITAVLGKMDQPGEEMWVQVMARPIDDSWQDKGSKYIEAIKSGAKPGFGLTKALLDLPIHVLSNLLSGIAAPPGGGEKKPDKKEEPKLSAAQQAAIKAVEEKTAKLGFAVKVRVAYLGPDKELAKQRIQAIVGAFKQYNTTNLNGFAPSKLYDSQDYLNEYRARLFVDYGEILNIEELASVYHLPHTNVETPNMVWNNLKTGEPPSNLPTEAMAEGDNLSLFGMTNFRGGQVKFGIRRQDRGRHLYIIGQTGTGKSQLMQILALSDLYHNHGIAIVDPHGDLASDIMKYIPEHRLKDVVYFNPADIDHPVAFNPMEVLDENSKHHMSSELVAVMKRMFDSWGPRLEYILRYTILALMDYPDATLLGITRMLTEKDFRKKVIKEVKDPVVRNFWLNEFASWNDKFQSEAIAPVLNKVGAFVANPLVRNVIGQPKSAFNLRQIMDEGKILIVNLSRGQVGEDNAAVLGALMITKMQLAAMSRANVPIEERRPFYLYVDEFQNFATDTFAVILSEARKYGLNLTVANQYIQQMPETVREAVFGNVGSMVSFRVGAGDSAYLAKYFEPTFEAPDLVKLNNRNMFITMSIEGEKAMPFSGRTLGMPEPHQDLTVQIIQESRQNYARPRPQVEEDIRRWNTPGHTEAGDLGEAPMEEQKPNILTELKNPHQPQPQPQRQQHQGGGQRRDHDRSRDRNRGQQPRGREQRHENRPEQPRQEHTQVQPSRPSQSTGDLNAGEVINLRK